MHTKNLGTGRSDYLLAAFVGHYNFSFAFFSSSPTRDTNLLLELLTKAQAKSQLAFDVATLSVGDMLWVARHKRSKKTVVLDCIVERKTIGDLESSIKDMRIKEQRSRLFKTGLSRVAYAIEGNLQHAHGLPLESLQGALASLDAVFGYQVQYRNA